MPDPDQNKELLEAARNEISAMAKEGLDHPSSKPVIVGAAAGAVAAAVLPVVTWPLGLVAGAAVALYLRIKK